MFETIFPKMESLTFRCVKIDMPLIWSIYKIVHISLKFIQIILAFDSGKYFHPIRKDLYNTFNNIREIIYKYDK